MNRLTAIGLASLVAYGLLIASKYTGVVSAARDERAPQTAALEAGKVNESRVVALGSEPRQPTLQLPPPVARIEPSKMSPAALEFRSARDLKAFADVLESRRSGLTGDERYHLAKALEECQFATTVNEDLAAYSAKKKREFLASLALTDPNYAKRVAAYDTVDNTQRCAGFQNAKISPKDIEDLYRAAAMQGDPRAQARVLTAEIGKGNTAAANRGELQNVRGELPSLIDLLQTRDPDAIATVGELLSRQSQQLRVGPFGNETPEASALLGAFALVACDMGQDCGSNHRELLQACAYAGYCNPDNYEALYQNFMASPWAYTNAQRYRGMIHTAITTREWSLIGLGGPSISPQATPLAAPLPGK